MPQDIGDRIIDAQRDAGYAKNRLENRRRAARISEGWSDQEFLSMPQDEQDRHVREQARLPVRDAEYMARANAVRANRRYQGRK